MRIIKFIFFFFALLFAKVFFIFGDHCSFFMAIFFLLFSFPLYFYVKIYTISQQRMDRIKLREKSQIHF